ncbi:MAG TPA: hypothetical protein VNO79_02610, partial [Actinomycetota bacterium]|nr:hypothetical protein [Actinomycetota bacterium]
VDAVLIPGFEIPGDQWSPYYPRVVVHALADAPPDPADWTMRALSDRTGLPLELLEPVVEALRRAGLVEVEGEAVRVVLDPSLRELDRWITEELEAGE